jgi:uncharacterized NAD(P)/FAD-binding protein YdhS
MVAVHLLRQQQTPVHVVLLNEGYPTGKGVAYSPNTDLFLLNVYAGRMSAFPDQPHHFVDWLCQQPAYAATPPDELEKTFMPRKVYGQYLEEQLTQALAQPAGQNTAQVLHQRVVDLQHTEQAEFPYQLQLQDGQQISAHKVVLALGNFQPSPLRGTSPQLAPPLYYHNPWKPEAWQNLPPKGHLLLIGTGLTSIDIILALLSEGFTGTITAISSNGYLPYPYRSSAHDLEFSEQIAGASSLRQVVSLFRKALQEKGAEHWEPLINGVRSQTQALWQRFSDADKKRFSQKLGSLWAVARHRFPPQVHAKIKQAMQDGFLQIMPGRIQQLQVQGTQVEVQLTSQGQKQTVLADRVVNCTGPQLQYAALPDPLVQSMLAQGLLLPHPMGMGLRADRHYRVLQANGQPCPGLFTLGAALRGELWESNAVPELREQAQALSQEILHPF